ncbi:SDR family NAD(P)-dependent oxidoreductase [Paenibacillus wynnii]|uniref:SDR family NAD(P)-dependent oxidoreductase n=1 Tax=Paenibacillus wynnii TaxID=268407 RepID=UPI0027908EC9|nr:SDR family NAD(P)-dependent oxidoreductase [Paenibacillus wynnii]MDQ0195448.1 NAD(P)-dependent dehydrogenase (short-subunit alcohol dehydrogenase family) [Paenibacillus wynnii]
MIILITGAGQGLGLETVRAAVERGHQVIAGIRSPAKDNEQLRELQNTFEGKLTVIQLDVNDEEAISKAKDIIEKQFGSIDALINNAGILIAREIPIEELDFADVEQSMLTNLYGPMKVVKHFLPMLRQSASPCIINISSEAGSFSGAYGKDYPYALSKSGLTYFSAQLRKALTPEGFVVYSVHPGWIRTCMGGEQATGDPKDSALGLVQLAEREVIPAQECWMINYKGEPMSF